MQFKLFVISNNNNNNTKDFAGYLEIIIQFENVVSFF